VEIVDLKLFIIESKVVTGFERNHFCSLIKEIPSTT